MDSPNDENGQQNWRKKNEDANDTNFDCGIDHSLSTLAFNAGGHERPVRDVSVHDHVINIPYYLFLLPTMVIIFPPLKR